MSTLQPDELLQHLRWRYATKKFDADRRIPEDTWRILEEALVLTPSSFGLQPWRFVVVTEPSVRAKLREASRNQAQITDASHLLVLQARVEIDEPYVDRHIQQVGARRKTDAAALATQRQRLVDTVVKGPMKERHNEWASRQVYIALGQFLVATAILGIDACPMEGIDRAVFDQLLGSVNTPFRTVVVAPAGYRSAADPLANQAKVRFAREDLVLRV